MAGTLVDSLVVTLGLDSKGFSDGIVKATGSLTSFVTKLAALSIGFDALDTGIQYFKELHRRMADLEFTARNFGVLGTELSKLGEFAQLFGGKMSDAQDSVEGLQAAVFNLRFKGQMSESLQMLQRFGVHFLDAQNHARDTVDVARDAAAAIDRQAQLGALNAGERYQMALSMGLTGGLASAAAQGAAGFEEAWRKAQEDQKGLSEGMLRSNARLAQDVTRRHAVRDVENMGVLQALIPGLEGLNEGLQKLAGEAIPYLAKGLTALTDAILHPPEIIKTIGRDIAQSAKVIEQSTKKLYDNTVLPPVKPGEKPVSLFVPFQGAWRLGELVTDRLDQWMSRMTGQLPPLAIPAAPPAAPTSGHLPPAQRGLVTPLAPRPAPSTSSPESSPAGGSSKPTAMNKTPTTSVVFENVTVNSRGTDGKALARDFTDTVKRKFLVAGADRGQA
jgi:hypothetical protein